VKAWFASLGAGLKIRFVGGTRLFFLAPLIPLIAIVPEFVQHIVEINLGMFASKDAFRGLAMDPTRWAFGYVKVAGLMLAIFAAARYWGGARERWWDLRTIAWRPFAIALAGNAALTVVMFAIGSRLSATAKPVFDAVMTITSLPMLVWLVGPLLGDATMTLRRAYTGGWGRLLLMAVLAAAAFWPASQLHQWDHRWAMGAPRTIVWALMAWDAVVVGLIACWTGAALGAGYRGASSDVATDPSTAPLPIR
jgi:hypothetical protein